jgi:hypothetical protein
MEQQEKKIITDIKKMAKEGQMVCTNVIWNCVHRQEVACYGALDL